MINESESVGGGGGTVSPFVSKSSVPQSHDFRKEAMMGGRNNGSLQTTPRRTMSPLKRFNKVAPSPVKVNPSAIPSAVSTQPAIATIMVQPSSLQSNSASLLEEKKKIQLETATEESERPGSAPLETVDREKRMDTQKNVPKPITLEPVIVVKSKNGDLVAQDLEDKGTV